MTFDEWFRTSIPPSLWYAREDFRGCWNASINAALESLNDYGCEARECAKSYAIEDIRGLRQPPSTEDSQ